MAGLYPLGKGLKENPGKGKEKTIVLKEPKSKKGEARVRKILIVTVTAIFILTVTMTYFLPTWIIEKNGENIRVIKKDIAIGYKCIKKYKDEGKVMGENYNQKLDALWSDTIIAEGKYESCKIADGFIRKIRCGNRLTMSVNKLIDRQEFIANSLRSSNTEIISNFKGRRLEI